MTASIIPQALRIGTWSSGECSFCLPDRRRRPRSIQGLAPRRIQPHRKVELACRSRQPVGFLVRTGPLVLDVDVERAIAVELELVAVAERKATKRVRCLEA